MNMESNRNYLLDCIKAIAAFCVIFIHYRLPSLLGPVTGSIARFAVPFFFMIAGFYCCTKQDESFSSCIVRKLRHTFLLIISSVAFFFVYEAVKNTLSSTLSDFLANTLTNETLLNIVFRNVGSFAYHLWFLFALAYCYAIMLAVDKFNLYSAAYIYIPVGIVLCLAMGELWGFPDLYYRNFLFLGLPFFFLGDLIRKKGAALINRISNPVLLVIILLSLIGAAFEGIYANKSELYISSCTLSAALFAFGIKNSDRSKPSFLSKIGQRYSVYIYLFHPLILDILYNCCAQNGLFVSLPFLKYAFPFAIMILSLLLAMLFYSILHRFKKRI